MSQMSTGEWLERLAPAWLTKASREARLELRALGELLDGARSALWDARRAWFVTLAPASALELHGRVRRLRRYPGESDDTYRARLVVARLLFREGGRRKAVLRMLAAVGYPTAEVVELYTLGPVRYDGTWAFNGEIRYTGAPRRGEYDIVLPLDAGGVVPDAMIALIRGEARRWAPVWARLSALILRQAASADAAPLPTDEPQTVTRTQYHLFDGSFTFDGTVSYSGFSASSEVI